MGGMGAYMSKPITNKISTDEVGKNVAFGASSMQGWRISQEDAHNCCIDFDKDVSLFAVYDGHGGHEVATYCARNLPEFIKQTEAYKRGDIRQALIDAFLGFDATLAKPEVVSILKELARPSTSDNKEDDLNDSDEEENVSNLRMEAAMPLDQVIGKYQSEVSNPHPNNLKNEKSNKRACPYLRGRKEKDKASCSSSGAGCSSSSSAWNTNEADVSSSSQPCGSSMSSTMKRKESSGNNEAEQVLDSTTSNGTVHASVPVVSTDDMETTKSADMPDSSEDVKEKVSSPGKSACSLPITNEVELNGAKSKRIEDADSSKGGGDNVSSSSCTPVENGDAGQQERISSSDRRRVQSIELYQSFLKKNDEESEGDDDDDENDESFDGVPESDEDDTEDVDEDESDEDEDGEDDDDKDDDDKDDDEDDVLNIEEPGSDSGCTAVVAILKENELYVANAGDSRCVLCRDGQALELSLDHKPEDEPEMKRIRKAGGKVTFDGRVNGGLNLSRALGDHAYKQNTVLPPQEQMISALPDVRHITIEPERDEFMILACDGIWNFMSSQDVVQFIKTRLTEKYDNISKICEELFDHCLAPDTLGDGTGCDNMTAVIVRFKQSSSLTTNATITEVCVQEKRSVSPSSPNKESNDCVTEENRMQSCKRLKTEAAI
ncbi:probable protein phosphatase CG10417 isoform X3 [Vespa velutina]|uniref:probable protein phosphatase CG10417 isoform X1 n=1 Tax=Vespa crabro TaxID=7445 RepID=UPI001F02ED08|nr:probable protein phosphatase CG10417 isoform X1 [Vespa crabro]XP_046827168.1 probable protein phosphatase CG10417 isoform X1 [Vespa crabro]XP_046827169.1 probable protein phosphatase CG10417 isoform X1 [Vespa crabro]XP_047359075.1 probable protein phosphatase CG10417 isoform X3 [Vespa velutina]XP_047359076.1 probable protein phosphatase CG10417 isoform X3 [Vespa velutina]